MISEFYADPKPIKKVYGYNNYNNYLPPQTTYYSSVIGEIKDKSHMTEKEKSHAVAMGISQEEYVRRHNIVNRLSKQISDWYSGSIKYPSTSEGYEKYGSCRLRGITKSLLDLEASMKWPSNDNPMIVSFTSLKTQEEIICTKDYLCDKPPQEFYKHGPTNC